MLHQKLDTVRFGRDRVIAGGLNHLDVDHLQFVTADRLLVGGNGPSYF